MSRQSHLEWSRDLETGIDVIDKQHHRIVEYINMMIDANIHQSRDEVAQVLTELVDYTLSHFTFEESLMEDAGYPFIRAHQRVHQLFVKRVTQYVQRFEAGEDIADELLNTLKSWLINHIRNDDNDYSDIVLKSLNTKVKESGWLANSLKQIFG